MLDNINRHFFNVECFHQMVKYEGKEMKSYITRFNRV